MFRALLRQSFAPAPLRRMALARSWAAPSLLLRPSVLRRRFAAEANKDDKKDNAAEANTSDMKDTPDKESTDPATSEDAEPKPPRKSFLDTPLPPPTVHLLRWFLVATLCSLLLTLDYMMTRPGQPSFMVMMKTALPTAFRSKKKDPNATDEEADKIKNRQIEDHWRKIQKETPFPVKPPDASSPASSPNTVLRDVDRDPLKTRAIVAELSLGEDPTTPGVHKTPDALRKERKAKKAEAKKKESDDRGGGAQGGGGGGSSTDAAVQPPTGKGSHPLASLDDAVVLVHASAMGSPTPAPLPDLLTMDQCQRLWSEAEESYWMLMQLLESEGMSLHKERMEDMKKLYEEVNSLKNARNDNDLVRALYLSTLCLSLDDMLSAQSPFEASLDATKDAARDLPLFVAAANRLAPLADKGVPSVPRLTKELHELRADLHSSPSTQKEAETTAKTDAFVAAVRSASSSSSSSSVGSTSPASSFGTISRNRVADGFDRASFLVGVGKLQEAVDDLRLISLSPPLSASLDAWQRERLSLWIRDAERRLQAEEAIDVMKRETVAKIQSVLPIPN